MLIIILLPATLVMVFWLVLQGMTAQEDWIAAAYSKVLDNRREIEKLERKDAAARERLSHHRGIAGRIMSITAGGGTEKARAKLARENEQLQNGHFKCLSVFPMPGYVLIRRVPGLGYGNIHKALLGKCSELYGKRHAESKSKQLLAKLLSYPMIGVPCILALGTLLMGAGQSTVGLAVLGIGSILVMVLVYAMYDELNDQISKRRKAISRQFPNAISKMALLTTSGMIVDKAWRETALSQNSELYLEMRRTAEELENLVPPEVAYAGFIDRCNTKETSKLASAILQNLSKGNAEIGVLFKEMARESWRERRHMAKRDSEAANSKLMIPTMLLFLTILVILMVPVAMNFASI